VPGPERLGGVGHTCRVFGYGQAAATDVRERGRMGTGSTNELLGAQDTNIEKRRELIPRSGMNTRSDMNSTSPPKSPIQIDDRLLTVAEILVGAGGVLLLAGMSVGGAAVRRAALQWLRQLDQPPGEVAKAKWQQLMTAKAAGADAWKTATPS